MLDNNPEAAAVKRYAPPSQRNRGLNRRKSDRFEKVNNSYGIDGEKNLASYSRNFPAIEHGEAASNHIQNENTHPVLIPINGCCSSEATQLLNDRWAVVMHLYNDPSVDSSEKPFMYSGASGSSWGHLKLPHQMDFLGELRRALQSTNLNAGPVAGDKS